jgi:lipoprotein NlpD
MMKPILFAVSMCLAVCFSACTATTTPIHTLEKTAVNPDASLTPEPATSTPVIIATITATLLAPTATPDDPISGAGACGLPAGTNLSSTEKVPYQWPTTSHKLVGTGHAEEYRGILLIGKLGEDILASADGVVVFAGESNSGMGNTVQLRHSDGTSTIYTILGKVLVQCGQTVKAGTPLAHFGEFGNTKDRLFEFDIRQISGESLDPLTYLP